MHEPLENDELRFELTIHEEGEEHPAIDDSVLGYFAGFVKLYKREELPDDLKDQAGTISELQIACDNMTVDEMAGILLFIRTSYPEAFELYEKSLSVMQTPDGPIVSFRGEDGEDHD